MALTKTKAAGAGRSRAAEELVRTVREAVAAPVGEAEPLKKVKTGYLGLGREEKPAFFRRLLEAVEVEPQDLAPLLTEASAAGGDPVRWRGLLVRLRAEVESPRRRLFRRFISLPGGLKFLLDLRADILAAQREGAADLEPLDDDLVRIFESWFQDGFLFLQEITLDSPYRQIEIIKNRDLVHPMASLEQMAQRLGGDRRCFALYHYAMPEEPVIFIEVALTRGLARSLEDILAPEAGAEDEEERRDTAVFYSINNSQNGLAGLGLGKVLIFQVVEHLKKGAPEVKTFCTLSPLPGFWRRYLKPLLEGRSEGFKMTREGLEDLFDKRARELLAAEAAARGASETAPLADQLLAVFSTPEWAENKALVSAVARPLTRLGYHYLTEEKTPAGRPLDPVANFHLSNGATLAPGNVNFGANWSPMGVKRSLSLMVNYVYSQSWLQQIRGSVAWLGSIWFRRPWR